MRELSLLTLSVVLPLLLPSSSALAAEPQAGDAAAEICSLQGGGPGGSSMLQSQRQLQKSGARSSFEQDRTVLEHRKSGHASEKGLLRHRPVSPALRCVTFLTLVFFGIYLAAVFMRIGRLASQISGKAPAAEASFEAKLVQLSSALAMTPMLCLLMISTRLRALQLHPGSEPQGVVQMCMYTSAGVFVLWVSAGLASDAEEGGGYAHGALMRQQNLASGAGERPSQAPRALYCMLSLALYASSFSILIMGTLAEGDGTGRRGGWTTGPALSPMVRCIAVVSATYFAESALREVLGAVHAQTPALAAIKEEEVPPPSLSEQLGLRLPVMVCVLLVGLELRAVQLGLAPGAWMTAAMYVTVASVVVQAAWSVSTAALRSYSLLSQPPAGTLSAALAQDAPESGGAAGGILQSALAAVWGVVVAAQYLGTAIILVGVFAMEGEQTDTSAVPPLSTAMRCVMLLTALYFATYLCLIGADALQGSLKKWAKTMLDSVQGVLAFVPMLCVMMIGVRLRAMQLRVRDPQLWAQKAMCVATFSVATQAVCSLCACARGCFTSDDADDAFDEQPSLPSNMCGKCVVIFLIFVRYIASMAMYVSVVLLVLALLLMEPALQL